MYWYYYMALTHNRVFKFADRVTVTMRQSMARCLRRYFAWVAILVGLLAPWLSADEPDLVVR